MQQTGEDGRARDLAERLARVEIELEAQRKEVAGLREALWRLQEDEGGGVREPAVAAETPAPVRWQALPAFEERVSQAPLLPPAVPAAAAHEAVGQEAVGQEAVGQEAMAHVAAPSPASTVPAPSGTMDKPEVRRSVENRIGSQVFNRIGIVALLIGVALALKFAVDRHWLHFSPSGRIATGLLLGAGVVLWSERFRRKGYGTFSYSLKAVGTGTLYLTLWASFQMYHLLPASVALIAMIGVTAWNAIMAWAQDSELLASYALVGGFATPALLGTGGNHEVFLFSYVLAMDLAVLFLLCKKPWQKLLLGSFPGTVIYFIGWYSKFFTADQASVTGLFAVVLSLPFVAVALVGMQREEEMEGVVAPLATAAFLSLSLYSVLQDSGRHGWLPWIAVALAGAYLLLMRVRRAGVAEAVHLALAVVFLTVSIPLKAEGRWITVGWLAEGVALLWVAAKLFGPEIQPRVRALMRWLGCGALGLGVVESLIFWSGQAAARSFWNGRFATEMFAVAALALAAWLARHPRNEAEINGLRASGWPVVSVASTLIAHLIGPLAVSRELSAFWSRGAGSFEDSQLSSLSIAAFVMVYGAGLVAWVLRRSEAEEFPTQRAMQRVVGLGYLGLGSLVMIVTPMVGNGAPVHVIWNMRMMFELVGAAALAATAWLAWDALRVRKIVGEGWLAVAAAALVIFNVQVLLAGIHEIVAYFGVRAEGDARLAEAFSISAWMILYAAALLAAGFWKRKSFVRWQGLILMVFTIGKVFLYDMNSLSSGYRILSVFGLGIVLMVVSFAYQKDWLNLRDADDEVAP